MFPICWNSPKARHAYGLSVVLPRRLCHLILAPAAYVISAVHWHCRWQTVVRSAVCYALRCQAGWCRESLVSLRGRYQPYAPAWHHGKEIDWVTRTGQQIHHADYQTGLHLQGSRHTGLHLQGSRHTGLHLLGSRHTMLTTRLDYAYSSADTHMLVYWVTLTEQQTHADY